MNRPLSVAALVLFLAHSCVSFATVLDVPDSFATIQAGIAASAEGDTVLVAPGTYYEHIDLSDKNITLASHYITTGDTMYMHETIIDGSANGTCITIKNEKGLTTPHLAGFTVQNAGYIITVNYGSGLRCSDADPVVEYMIFKDNIGRFDGGGCNFLRSNPVIEHVFMVGNRCDDSGGGARFYESNPVMKNVFIIDNSGSHGGGLDFSSCDSALCENVIVRREDGNVITCYDSTIKFYRTEISHNIGELFVCGSSSISFVNSILYGYNSLGMVTAGSSLFFINSIVWFENSSSQIQIGNSDDIPQNILIFENSVLKNGVDGIVGIYGKLIINKDIFISDNTISNNPLFKNQSNNNFYLQQNSPCIDAGTKHFEWNGETIVDYSIDDYNGSAPDIGFYEYDPSINVKKDENDLPSILLLSPFPNPFNSSVTIPYKICNYTYIAISIYNLSGQKVAQLSSDYYAPGHHSVTWDATWFASGLYYCMISDGHSRQIRKIQYLK